jgi:hypothetical protein
MRMSAAAFAYVKREHDLERVADLYLAAVEEGAGGAVVRDSVVLDVARAANEVGIGRNDPQLAEIAARFHEVGLGN